MRPSPSLFAFIALTCTLLSACAVPTQPVETLDFSTRTPTPTPTATLTIQWFPPTQTPTPLASRTFQPTVDRRPGITATLLEEDFESSANWDTRQSQSGNIAVSSQRLTLAVATPGGYLSSLRQTPILDDFYLEISASPSLCKVMDSYGLILRAAEENTFYRFALTCSGLVRLEEVVNNRANLLQDWTPSGQVPLGAPARLRLGVWAYGDEMRFFIGDVFQFSVQKLALLQGQIGVFAQSAGSTALTVSFSDLVVYSLGVIPSTPTPTSTPVESSPTP